MQFLYTIIILATAVGVGGVVCHPTMRDAVRGALGVLLVTSMAIPFVGAVSSVVDLDRLDMGGQATDGLSEITAIAFADGVRDAITEEFSINCDIRVIVRDFSAGDLIAGSVTVVIPTTAAHVDFRAVREYVEDNFTRVGGCDVVYG